jgi:hypothetical protein
MIIIIVLKLNSAVDQERSLDHGSGWPELTRVIRIKVVIIIILRSNSRVNPRQDSSQYKNKNGCYHSLKTWLGGI